MIGESLGRAVLELDADDRKLKRQMAQSERDVDQLGGRLKGKAGTAVKAAGIGVAAGIGIAVVAVKGFADAARDSEVSNAKMRAQLKASNISYREHGDAIDKVIQKVSHLSGLDDEDLQDAFTNIVRVTGDVNKSMNLVGLAADFARAKNIDVAKAGEIVAKVAGGNTGILSRYGIKIKEGATATEALGEMQKRFGGQAEAYGKTTAGAQERFAVATENLQEKLGQHLLPIVASVAGGLATFIGGMEAGTGAGGQLVATVQDIIGVVSSAVTWLYNARGAFGSVALAVGPLVLLLGAWKLAMMAQAAWIAIVAAATTGWTAVQGALNVVMSLNPIMLVVIAIAVLVGAILVAYKHSETFRNAIDKLWKAFTSTFNWIKAQVPTILNAVGTAARNGLLGPIPLIISRWNQVKAVLVAAFNAIKGVVSDVAGAVTGLPGKIQGVVKSVGKAAEDFAAPILKFLKPVRDLVDKVWGFVEKIIDGLKKVKDTLSNLKFPKVPDLNPFGGSGGGNVGPGRGHMPSAVDGFNDDAAGFGNVVTSAYRPGDDGYHGRNRARDYAGGNMLGFAKYMAQRFGSKLTELIHTPLGFGIKNGQAVGLGFWGKAVNDDHYDHVHVALADGGYLKRPARALVGERGPEIVDLPGGSIVHPYGEGMGSDSRLAEAIEQLNATGTAAAIGALAKVISERQGYDQVRGRRRAAGDGRLAIA